jgi:hypothetical protein
MTTFTTEDRIFAEKDGSFTVNVEGGTVSSPPHIVNSGASVMIKDLTDEEILIIWREDDRVYPMQINKLLERSRALLRKARE